MLQFKPWKNNSGESKDEGWINLTPEVLASGCRFKMQGAEGILFREVPAEELNPEDCKCHPDRDIEEFGHHHTCPKAVKKG